VLGCSVVTSVQPPKIADAPVRDTVEVMVTLAVWGAYHYRVPARFATRAVVGARVLVRFGGKVVTGVIVRAGTPVPTELKKLLDLTDVLDDEPSLSAELLELCQWMSNYYEAPPGEVIKGALPAGSNVSARRLLALTEAGEVALESALPPKPRALLGRLEVGAIPSVGLSTALRKGYAALIEQGLVREIEEREEARAQLKRERTVELAMPIEQAREAVARAPKRLAIVNALIDGPVAIRDLPVKAASTAVRELAKAGVVKTDDREAELDAAPIGDALMPTTIPTPTAEQVVAIEAITKTLRENVVRNWAASSANDLASSAVSESTSGAPVLSIESPTFVPFLLHGVTGSGKTEVYLRVIAEALELGRTALVLVPEISLTPQLAARFRARFGDQVAILHSGLTDQARLGEWSRLRRGQAHIAVGARSAIFAPLENLGVIVVDEEHDGSFKQEEGVRYHARDVALVRAQRAGALCVLGSATPSLESYAHAERGQYSLLTLTQRPTSQPMPSVEVVDLRLHVPDGEAMLSAPLRIAITETLAAGDQVILFLNRRGFSTFVMCRACGHSFRCPNCSVSMTYHRSTDKLTCHYCAKEESIPDTCPECKRHDTIVRKGLGTEKIAEAVAAEFASARVARLDRDVASGARAEVVLSRVARREVDILVGTQMVTKGHDFPGVTLVGVLCADTGLDLPDFRASERTFQLLAQVAGRAGRGERPGRVIIQTYRPGASAVVAAAAHDYERFFRAESAARADLHYPPHGRLILVRIDGRDERKVEGIARKLARVAETASKHAEVANTVEVLGPVAAPLEKLRTRTRWQVWLRGTDRTALRRVARTVAAVEVPTSGYGGVRVQLDVDPNSAL
jgi:primosomal protein N' (replication factor Y)